jgi:hypothetical protein
LEIWTRVASCNRFHPLLLQRLSPAASFSASAETIPAASKHGGNILFSLLVSC